MPRLAWVAAIDALPLLVLLSVAVDATVLSSGAQSMAGNPFYDLLIVIPCHGTRDVARRNAIRHSWAQYATSAKCEPCQKRKVKVLFVAGQEGDHKEMAHEAAQFHDLGVLPDFGQFTYYTSRAEKTQKSLRYALEHYRFRLLLKADTDSWVFVDRLLNLLEDPKIPGLGSLFALSPEQPGVYAGDFADGSGVHAVDKPDAKWYDGVFKPFTGGEVYPRHAKGAAYLLSPDLVAFVAAMDIGGSHSDDRRSSRKRHKGDAGASADADGRAETGDGEDEEGAGWARLPRLENLPSEDVSMGFWLQAINHTKVELPVSIKDSACTDDRRRDLAVDHYVSPEEMATRWCRYLAAGDPCDVSIATERKCAQPELSLLASGPPTRTRPPGRAVRIHGVAPPEPAPAPPPAPPQQPMPLLRQRRLVGAEAGTHREDGREAQRRKRRGAGTHAAGRAVSNEGQAWMLMQHGTGLSEVSGRLEEL